MTEQEINNLIDSKIGKTKMSQLPEATQTSGLYSIGYTGNQSVKYKTNLLQGDPLTVRKTYQTEALALADKNPIDTTTSLPLTVGQFVSIVDDGEKNGIYRISSISGDGTMSLELQGKLGDLSEYVKTTVEDDDGNISLQKQGQDLSPKTNINAVKDTINGNGLENRLKILELQGVFKINRKDVSLESFLTGSISSNLYEGFSVFESLTLIGFDKSKPHKISLLRKQVNDYRIIIQMKTDGVWVRAFDKDMSEELSHWDVTSGDKRMIASLNWDKIPMGFNAYLEADVIGDNPSGEPPFIISKDCFVGAETEVNFYPTPIATVPTDVMSARFGKDLFPCFVRYAEGSIDKTILADIKLHHVLSAFKSLKIYGASKDKIYKLGLFRSKYGADLDNYGFQILELDNDEWTECYYVSSTNLIKNDNGVTTWNKTNKGIRVEASILWDNVPENFSRYIYDDQETPSFIINPDCIMSEVPTVGNVYDQSLNTFDSVQFSNIKTNALEIEGVIPTGTLLNPPLELQTGDQWADTTDSEEHPLIRIKL